MIAMIQDAAGTARAAVRPVTYTSIFLISA
jgi:hypothetical protein